jgi:hypothetical protein
MRSKIVLPNELAEVMGRRSVWRNVSLCTQFPTSKEYPMAFAYGYTLVLKQHGMEYTVDQFLEHGRPVNVWVAV